MSSEPQSNGKRRLDFKVGVGPFSFEGSGINVLIGVLAVAVLLLVGLMYLHINESQAMTKAVGEISEGNKLLACIITREQRDRAAELRGRDTDCRRFARGEL